MPCSNRVCAAWPLRLAVLCLGMVAVGFPAQAWSEEDSGTTIEGEESEHGHGEYHNIVAARDVALLVIGEHVRWLFGIGVLYERTFIPDLLEVEFSTISVYGGNKAAFPVDLVFKVPWNVSNVVELYFGLGPAVTIAVTEEFKFHVGGIASLGSYLWVSKQVGVLLEFDYALAQEEEGLVHELEFSTGLVHRF